MIEVADPIRRSLRDFAIEKKRIKESKITSGPIGLAIGEAELINIKDLKKNLTFLSPKLIEIEKTGPTMANIHYKRAKKDVEKAKRYFDVRTNLEVGEKTFDYWFEDEGDN